MTAADWLAERRRIEQAATDGPWMSEWDTSDEWWTIHGQPNPTKGDERMVCPEVATLQHSEDWTADVDFIADARTALPKALDALEAVLKEAWRIESGHHFHGIICICGYASHLARDRTEHLTRPLTDAIEAALRAES